MAILTVHARQTDPVEVFAAGGGDSFANDGATELLIRNTSQTAVTVTAAASRRCSHGFLDDSAIVVDPGELQRFGPFAASRFNDTAGRVSVSYSAVTGITVAAQRQR